MQIKYHFGNCKHSHIFIYAVLPHSYFYTVYCTVETKNLVIIKLKGAIFKILLTRVEWRKNKFVYRMYRTCATMTSSVEDEVTAPSVCFAPQLLVYWLG